MIRMLKIIRISAVVLLLGAIATMVLVVRQYRWGRTGIAAQYTRIEKERDILDTSRNALAALNDAALQAEHYVLSGETVYSEAYANDVREWEDECGTLVVVAEKDQATPMALGLQKAGRETLDELSAVMAVYDKSGRDQALDRIRKTSSIVYFNRARKQVSDIIAAYPVDPGRPLLLRSDNVVPRLTEYAAGLFVMTVAALALVLGAARRFRA